jgi:hypothetical protein
MSADPKPTIEELDGILSQARKAWLSAKTPAAERKARRQIDELLDLRLALMDDRDLAPVLDYQPPTH